MVQASDAGLSDLFASAYKAAQEADGIGACTNPRTLWASGRIDWACEAVAWWLGGGFRVLFWCHVVDWVATTCKPPGLFGPESEGKP